MLRVTATAVRRSMATAARGSVTHVPAFQQFLYRKEGQPIRQTAATKQDDDAFIQYRVVKDEPKDRVIDLHLTFTPPSMRGQGVAEILGRGTLEQIQQENKSRSDDSAATKVVLGCSYLNKKFSEDPSFADIVVSSPKL